MEYKWWWRHLWKYKCLAKSKLLMWSILEQKVSTSDILQKRQFHGPRCYSLCKNSLENINHLFLECPFSSYIWPEALRTIDCNINWQGQSAEDALRLWMLNQTTNPFKYLPLIISYGVWITRKNAIFQEALTTPPIVVAQAIGILAHFPQEKEEVGIRVIHLEEIDPSKLWGYFVGVADEDQQ